MGDLRLKTVASKEIYFVDSLGLVYRQDVPCQLVQQSLFLIF